MANKNLSEMVFILDRSGSMAGLEKDTIGGFNSLIEKQKKEQGEAVVTLILFDDQYELIYEHADINKIKPLTNKEYYARGMTALLDAVGKAITQVKNRHLVALENEVPNKTMVVIITDGCENASREFNLNGIKKMIENQKSECQWEFMFLGANIDAVSAAADIGITADRAVTYQPDEEGTRMNFDSINSVAECVRKSCPIMPNWKENIEKHRKSKKLSK